LKTRETISTRSLWCSAYLALRGHKLIEFELVSPHNGYFIFPGSPSAKADLEDFYTTNPEVPVRSYLDKYSELRSLVMRAKRKAGGGNEQRPSRRF
jgi:hypothetical protein